MTDELGKKWHLLDNGLKPYSCCHLIHAVFDALDNIRDETPLRPEDIKAVRVATNSEPILSHIGSIIEPEDILGAQFSLPFSVAMRLHNGNRGMHGGNGFWDYAKVNFKDRDLQATARKVSVFVAKDQSEWSSVDKGAGVEVETIDGRVLQNSVTFSKGLPENPLAPAEVEEKFHYLVDPVMAEGVPSMIVEKVNEIEEVADICEIVKLLVVTTVPDTKEA